MTVFSSMRNRHPSRISIALGLRTVRTERLQRLIGLSEGDWWIGRE